MGGGAAVTHFQTDLGGPAASPRSFLACHWLSQIQFLSANELMWHDQVSNNTARSWRLPGLSMTSAMTIETQESLNESERFRTYHSTHVWGVVGRFAAAFCGAHCVNQGMAAAFPRHWFRSLARSFLAVLAAGGGGRRKTEDGINLWTCQWGKWDKILSAPRGILTSRRQARRDARVNGRRHRRRHRLFPTMDDPLDVSADAMLADPVEGEVATVVAANMKALWRYRRRIRRSRLGRRRYMGSVPGRRPNRNRDFRSGLRAILRDNFGLDGFPPAHDEVDFERRFRVSRSVFLRIYDALKGRPFFVQRIQATGRPQAHPLPTVVAAFRVIAYGEAPDRSDDYVRLSASTIAMSVRGLLHLNVDELGTAYLRPPTPAELERILESNAQRGLSECKGSLDCSHWEWANFPRAFAGIYQNRNIKRSVVMETVFDEDLWIWHLFVSYPGSQNDLNVLHALPLYLSVTGGE